MPSSFGTLYSVDPDSGCWNWEGNIFSTGYGTYCGMGAHRFSYEAHGGELIPGMHIDHLCRNRKCVNPEHLEQVTPKENFLRGVGWGAVNARKTHCPQGHEYSEENTLKVRRKGSIRRLCATCNRATQRRIYQRNKLAGTLPPSASYKPRKAHALEIEESH